MKIKVKGALFKHCVSFSVPGNDRSMSKRLHQVSRIIKKDSKRITQITIKRQRPLAAEQIYDVKICGLVDTIKEIKRAVKGAK